jgi:hypothetical protein
MLDREECFRIFEKISRPGELLSPLAEDERHILHH